MAKDRPTKGFRFKKRVPIIKLPFGLGDVKVNLSMSHGIESITAQGKLGKLQSNINYNLHKQTVQGLTSVSGTGLSKQYTLHSKEPSKPKTESKEEKKPDA
tara:strand:- start:19 stop:321 length:303 start_codon:yes stop_codon:yes gene_type:complete